MIVYERTHGSGSNHPSPAKCPSDPQSHNFIVRAMYPKAEPPRVPAHIPDDLGSFFFQAADNLKRQNWDASGAMSRKVVDVSTQQLLQHDAKKFGSIQARIDEVENRSLITDDLREWAHQIRLGGNEAAHDP